MGGGTRTIKFLRDNTVKEVIDKFAGKACNVRVPSGLPNTTRPSASYYQNYNFEREPWWPKFEKLKSKFNITIVKGDKQHKQRAASNNTNTNNKMKSLNSNNNNFSDNAKENVVK